MKINLICFLTLFYFQLNAQSFLSHFKFHAGFRLHNVSTLDLVGGSWQLSSSPELGIAWFSKNEKFGIKYRRIITYGGTEINKELMLQSLNSTRYDEINEIDIFYNTRLKKIPIRIGVGYANKKLINKLYFITQGYADYKHKTLSFSTQIAFNKFNVEFKKLIQISPGGFGLFERYLYAISLNKEFNLIESKREDHSKVKLKGVDIFPLFSMRTQANKYYKNNKDIYHPVQINPGIGFEIFIKKINTSILFSRDFWIRYTGGLLSNDVIGYIITNNLGINHYINLANNKTLMIGLSFHPIYNKNEPKTIGVKIVKDEFGDKHPLYYTKYANIRGLGLTLSYSLTKNYFIELRQIFPYIGDYFFNPYYTSIGITYRWKNSN